MTARRLRQTDVFRTRESANSDAQDQQLTAVLAERFFEQCPKRREGVDGRIAEGADRGAAADLLFLLFALLRALLDSSLQV
jgi:hypothetical protein